MSSLTSRKPDFSAWLTQFNFLYRFVDDDAQLNVLLRSEENPTCSSRQIALENDIGHTTVDMLQEREISSV